MTHTSRQFIWASLISILSFVFYTQTAFAFDPMTNKCGENFTDPLKNGTYTLYDNSPAWFNGTFYLTTQSGSQGLLSTIYGGYTSWGPTTDMWNGDYLTDVVLGQYIYIAGPPIDGDIIEGDCAGPPPPPPPGSLGDEISAAQQGFASTTGFDIVSVISWAGDNLIKLFIGSLVAILYELRYWIAAMLIIGAIIGFALRNKPRKKI